MIPVDTRRPGGVTDWFDPRTLAALEGLDFKARYVVEGTLAGLHASPFHGFSVEFCDYRDYQPGDDLRHVDWRLFARSDRLCLKRYMLETNVRFHVLCDTSASMAYRGAKAWGSKLDVSRLLAAAMGWLLLRQNDAAGLLALGAEGEVPRFLPPSQSPSQRGIFLQELDALKPAGGERLARLLTHAARLIPKRSVIVILSDLLEPAEDLAMPLRRLRFHGHEILVFQVLDPDEVEFPFTENQIFEDLETGHRRTVSPDQAREAYRRRFNAFMAAHEHSLRSLEIPHVRIRTDGNPTHALAAFLAQRRRLK